MKNYSEMSDFEIIRKVGDIVGVKWAELDHNYHELSAFFVEGLGVFDPCSSWDNAGPIIAYNKICLAYDVFAEPHDGGKWVSQPAYGWSHERVRDDNPLRAAMIVFLMMKEEK